MTQEQREILSACSRQIGCGLIDMAEKLLKLQNEALARVVLK